MAADGCAKETLSKLLTPYCPICHDIISLSSPDPDEAPVLLGHPRDSTTCGHCFHKGCIARWMQIKSSCPICKNSGVQMHVVRMDTKVEEEDGKSIAATGKSPDDDGDDDIEDATQDARERHATQEQSANAKQLRRTVSAQGAVNRELLQQMKEIRQESDRQRGLAQDAIQSMEEANDLLASQNRKLVFASERGTGLARELEAATKRIRSLESSSKRKDTLLASMRYLSTFSTSEYISMFKHLYSGGPVPEWVLAQEAVATGDWGGGKDEHRGVAERHHPSLLMRASTEGAGASSLRHSHGHAVVCRSERLGMPRAESGLAVRALQSTAKAIQSIEDEDCSGLFEQAGHGAGRRKSASSFPSDGRVRPSAIAGATGNKTSWGTEESGFGSESKSRASAVASVKGGRGGIATRAAFAVPRTSDGAYSGAVPPMLPSRGESRSSSSRPSSSLSSAGRSGESRRAGGRIDSELERPEATSALREARAALQHLHTCCLMIRSRARLAASWEEATAHERAARARAERRLDSMNQSLKEAKNRMLTVRRMLRQSEQRVRAYGQALLERGALLPQLTGDSDAGVESDGEAGQDDDGIRRRNVGGRPTSRASVKAGSRGGRRLRMEDEDEHGEISEEEEDDDDVVEVVDDVPNRKGLLARSRKASARATGRASADLGMRPPRLSQRAAKAFQNEHGRGPSPRHDPILDPIMPSQGIPPTLAPTLAPTGIRQTQIREGLARAAGLVGALVATGTPGERGPHESHEDEDTAGGRSSSARQSQTIPGPRSRLSTALQGNAPVPRSRSSSVFGFDLTLADEDDPDLLHMSGVECAGDPIADPVSDEPPAMEDEDEDSDATTDDDELVLPTDMRSASASAPRKPPARASTRPESPSILARAQDSQAVAIGPGNKGMSSNSISGRTAQAVPSSVAAAVRMKESVLSNGGGNAAMNSQLGPSSHVRGEHQIDKEEEEEHEEYDDEEDMLGNDPIEDDKKDEEGLERDDDAPEFGAPAREAASRRVQSDGSEYEQLPGVAASLGATLMPLSRGFPVTGALAAPPASVPQEEVSATAAIRQAADVVARRRRGGHRGVPANPRSAVHQRSSSHAVQIEASTRIVGPSGALAPSELDNAMLTSAASGGQAVGWIGALAPGEHGRPAKDEQLQPRCSQRGEQPRDAHEDEDSADLVAHLTSILGVGIEGTSSANDDEDEDGMPGARHPRSASAGRDEGEHDPPAMYTGVGDEGKGRNGRSSSHRRRRGRARDEGEGEQKDVDGSVRRRRSRTDATAGRKRQRDGVSLHFEDRTILGGDLCERGVTFADDLLRCMEEGARSAIATSPPAPTSRASDRDGEHSDAAQSSAGTIISKKRRRSNAVWQDGGEDNGAAGDPQARNSRPPVAASARAGFSLAARQRMRASVRQSNSSASEFKAALAYAHGNTFGSSRERQARGGAATFAAGVIGGGQMASPLAKSAARAARAGAFRSLGNGGRRNDSTSKSGGNLQLAERSKGARSSVAGIRQASLTQFLRQN